MLVAEPLTEPAETADHLVAAEQDAIFAADGFNARPVTGGRDDDTAGALHRFTNERRDILRPGGEDRIFHLLRGAGGERVFVLIETVGEFIGLHHVHEAGQQGPALRVHRRHAAQAHAGDGRSVIAIDAADDHLPLRFTLHLPIMARSADQRVDRLAAG